MVKMINVNSYHQSRDLNLQINRLYRLLVKSQKTSQRLEEQVLLHELQLELLKLQSQAKTIVTLQSSPEVLGLSRHLRRRALLLKRQYLDISSRGLFHTPQQNKTFLDGLSCLVEDITHNINRSEHVLAFNLGD